MATTKTAKTVTYTAEQTAELKAAYVAATDAAGRDAVKVAFAEKFGKNLRSITQKLVRENVYVKAEYVTKTGEKPVVKDETADAIAAILGMTEAEATSLTKANKTALVKIFKALADSQPAESLTPENQATKGENVAKIAGVLEMTESEAKSLARCGAEALAVLASQV